jgi:transcriptional regulator with XRE-family HTH domain
MTSIRDLREKKNLSQDKVAEAAGLTYSAFVRVEQGRTSVEEFERVLEIVKGMERGPRKLGGGRPFKDPEKQARVREARATGHSIAKAMGIRTPRAQHRMAS